MSAFDLGALGSGRHRRHHRVRCAGVTAACTWVTACGSTRGGRPTSWTSRCPDVRPLSSRSSVTTRTLSTSRCSWMTIPARTSAMLRQPGHRFFFGLDDLERLDVDGGAPVSDATILVAGIGNIFLGDDGFGVEVVASPGVAAARRITCGSRTTASAASISRSRCSTIRSDDPHRRHAAWRAAGHGLRARPRPRMPTRRLRNRITRKVPSRVTR